MSVANMPKSIPYLRQTSGDWQLYVDGKPFLMLAAELQNSSLSSTEYMRSVWPTLKEASVNTVLGCVTWEHIEPVEGEFDFEELDSIIHDAREHGLHLILLWFGAFKNGLSTYAPSWVKQNSDRFPRVILRKAGGILQVADVLSLFHPESMQADANAFRRLMQHIRMVDEAYGTVLMVQVENEVGILGDSRDASLQANNAFSQAVPDELTEMLDKRWNELHATLQSNLGQFRHKGSGKGSWEGVFGQSLQTDELFMAYHFARYVEYVAAAGKAEYPLPMFTNVWQNYADGEGDEDTPIDVGGGGQPGDYPSGGGVINVIDVWHQFAPSLDFIAPDIYLNDYNKTCAKYKHGGQALLIPEQRRDEYGARRIWSAFGSYQALATAPFGIDTTPTHDNPWKKHYGLLSKVSYYVLMAQQHPELSFGFFFDETEDAKGKSEVSYNRIFGQWRLEIERAHVFGKEGPGFGLIVHLHDNRFLLVGEGFQVRFKSIDSAAVFTGILSFKEQDVINVETGELKTGRRLNGDETRSGAVAVMPSEDPDYGGFPISITIPARTRIAECSVYSLKQTDQRHLLN